MKAAFPEMPHAYVGERREGHKVYENYSEFYLYFHITYSKYVYVIL